MWGILPAGFALCAAFVSWGSGPSRAAALAPAGTPESRAGLERRFTGTVRPFLQSYCISCHGKDKPQAQLDLSTYHGMESVTRDYAHWTLILDKLEAKQMPPKGTRQPSEAVRNEVIAWIRGMRQFEARRNAGDPGTVLARRLSNAEYDYTIRDLTGVELRPTREFPVDPANQEGFDNSGESLTISPALMKKYYQAARSVADHLAFTSTGLAFASHPVLVETDRDKFSILRIIDFYKRQPTDYADYFQAAWRYRHRAALGMPQASLQSVATQAKVSSRYLELVWKTLNSPDEKVGPIARLQGMWNVLPAPDPAHPDAARAGCVAMRDWIVRLRPKLAKRFTNLRIPQGFSPGGQCFIMWKNEQYASHRRRLNPDALQIGGVPKPWVEIPATDFGGLKKPETIVPSVDPELAVPQDEAARAPYVAAFQRFCDVFPDAFYVSERGRMHVDRPGEKGRFLSAGLHNAMGYFRDDTPLVELILDEDGRKELDRLWVDFNIVASVPQRMHLEFFHYERAETSTMRGAEFDFARSEDKDATSEAKVKRLAEVYLAKARRDWAQENADPVGLQAIEAHFERVNRTIRATEKARLAAEPLHLEGLLDFARRAYRRPLTAAERTDLLAFYRSLREKEGLPHEEAARDVLVRVLVSPHFLYRIDLDPLVEQAGGSGTRTERAGARPAGGAHGVVLAAGPAKVQPGSKRPVPARKPTAKPAAPHGSGSAAGPAPVRPLSDYALASRLSYFLWSSMPDEELLSHAKAGDLHKPEVLVAQTRRMLKDPKARALAVEFGGNWLDFRRFEEHNAVDRDRFPGFNDELRTAMFEEPVRFLQDLFQRDGSVLELLYGKHTFVNASLARHYGMREVKVEGSDWVRVEDAARYGRGGVLPMAVFLTKNAPGLRTSPVKRGYWVVRRVLGEHIPPPPPTVPELPKDEGQLGNLTLRQALEKHRDNPACSGCHARFDSYGLVFEGYGPVGEARTKDLGGKAVDTRAPFPGGKDHAGVEGLQAFIRAERQDDFLDNLCRKLLAYGLGRTLLPSDDPLLQQMRQQLTTRDHRISTLVEAIVTSRQFRYRRAVAGPAG